MPCVGIGQVFLVGAGPGDPTLITVKGQQLLRRADVVVYDHLTSPQLLRQCRSQARLIYVGKKVEGQRTEQSSINALLVREARAGRLVVRLKGGDPFLFGRGGEEALELVRAHIPYQVVPGVSSALAVPAYAGIPLTDRSQSSSVGIVTGHEGTPKHRTPIRWEQLAAGCDTLVCLMSVATLPKIAARLLRSGRGPTTPCAVIEWGTTPAQRTITGSLKRIAQQARDADIRPPAILVVGEVVTLRDALNWFERQPLFGKRILVTRAAERAQPLTDTLESLGAMVEVLPAIEFAAVDRSASVRRIIAELPQINWVFFTSPEGIGWFRKLLNSSRKDLRWLHGCHVGAIGEKTAAAIEAYGVHVDFVPQTFSQEGMVRELVRRKLRGKRAVILSALKSQETLESGLRACGMEVRKVPIYRTVMPKHLSTGLKRLLRQPFDLVTVTSASCVEHLTQALTTAGLSAAVKTLQFASIGPITSAAVRRVGGRVAVEASQSTVEALAEAITRHAARSAP